MRGLFCRQYTALCWKNWLLKRRQWLSSILELAIPCVFIFALGLIRAQFKAETFDGGVSYQDFPLATLDYLGNSTTYPNVLCWDNNLFMRCSCDYTRPTTSVLPSAGLDISYYSTMASQRGPAVFNAAHANDLYNYLCYSGALNTPSDTTTGYPSDVDNCTLSEINYHVCNGNNMDWNMLNLCGVDTNSEITGQRVGELVTLGLSYAEFRGAGLSVPADEIDSACERRYLAIAPVVASADGGAAAAAAQLFAAHLQSVFPALQDQILSFDSEGEINSYVRNKNYGSGMLSARVGAAVIFNAGSPAWDYSLRSNYSRTGSDYNERNTPATTKTVDNSLHDPWSWPSSSDEFSQQPYLTQYYSSGTLTLQTEIDRWIMELEGVDGGGAEFRVANYPWPAYEAAQFWSSVGDVFSILMIISVIFPVSNVIRALVQEKELRIKEGMKMMGLGGGAHVASWITQFGIQFLLLSILLVLASGPLFKSSDSMLVFLYFLFFFTATVSFCFFLSSFFSRARTAATLGTLAFFCSLFPYYAVSGDDVPAENRRAACLLPAACFALGTVSFREYEDTGEGVTVATASEGSYGFTFSDVLGMLILDTFLYAGLAWYALQVVASEWGTSRPLWFPFSFSYWSPARAGRRAARFNQELLDRDESEGPVGGGPNPNVEPVGEELRGQVTAGTCVAIRGLRRVFKNATGGAKTAVDGLDLTMYRGQITALLGHNGAGKTTTIGMLVGMIPVSSGLAFINGRDATTEMARIRENMGVCPQHDILYPELTVREHLVLFAAIKGVPRKQVKEEVEKMIVEVGLTEKRHERSKALSGGQKRKLSIGMAFIGGSETVFLDEPTSGMDPHSRRYTWDIIKKNRAGRVVVLVSHFLDECDLLGDRIAIMSHGRLRCCGSSLFLKNRFGVGYNLTLVRAFGKEHGDAAPTQPASPVAATAAVTPVEDFNNKPLASPSKVGKKQNQQKQRQLEQQQQLPATAAPLEYKEGQTVSDVITAHVPSAKLLSDVGMELSFQLPSDAASSFKALLGALDRGMAGFGLSSYGLSVTTLEEVFLRVAHGTDDEQGVPLTGRRRASLQDKAAAKAAAEADIAHTAASTDGDGCCGGADRVTGTTLFFMHMYALLQKRRLTFGREKRMWGFAVFAPALFVAIGVAVLASTAAVDQPSLTLSTSVYNSGGGLDPRNPLPWAEACASGNKGGTCDPASLLAAVAAGGSAQPEELELRANYMNTGGALNAFSNSTLAAKSDYDASLYSGLLFYAANDTAAGAAAAGGAAAAYDFATAVNFTAVHGAPTFVNIMSTGLLQLLTGDTSLSITTRIHPLPYTNAESSVHNEASALSVILFIMVAFAFIPSAWVVYVVRERENKCKHQQMVSGVNLEAYWLSAYVWDVFFYTIPAGATLAILAIAGVDSLVGREEVGAVALLLGLYGLASPPFHYAISFLFTKHAAAQVYIILLGFILGLLAPLTLVILQFIDSTRSAGVLASHVLRIFPPFSLGSGLYGIGFRTLLAYFKGRADPYTVWAEPIAGRSIIMLAAMTPFYIFLTLFLERRLAGTTNLAAYIADLRVRAREKHLSPYQLGDEDEIDADVAAERSRVEGGGAAGEAVRVAGLRKLYPSSSTRSGGVKVAIKSTFLGIPRGECFGLLGINGAGKTTTLSILSGETAPTAGAAFLAGHDVMREPEAIHRLVGFCPQFDALFELMTAREHLRLYGCIKGIPAALLEQAVSDKIQEMSLMEYADKPAGGYSGGNKRKLSVAVSMIGGPEIVFLDEPSTGMDPVARRGMWEVISNIVTRDAKCAMILTSHSMEETEALCSRIGIMVGGRLRCLGSSQHLKSRFGDGHQMEVSVRPPATAEIDSALSAMAVATTAGAVAPSGLQINKDQLPVVLAAAGHGDLAAEISATGRGATLHATMTGRGAVPGRDVAAWAVGDAAASAVADFVLRTFAGAAVRERQGAKLRFELPPQPGMALGDMFGVLEDSREGLGIVSYSLSQTSLEQIFNFFASQQEEELGAAAGLK